MKESEIFIQNNYDEEYAVWLKEAFPKSVNRNIVNSWKTRGSIPRFYYFVSPVQIHGIPLNALLLFEGHSQKDVANELGIARPNFSQYLIKGDMPTKYIDILKKKYASYKNKKDLVPKIKVVHDKHYFLEYQSDLIHLKAAHSAQTKNKGVLFFSKTMFVDGRVSDKEIDGVEYSDFIKKDNVQEVTLKKVKTALKAANKRLLNVNI